MGVPVGSTWVEKRTNRVIVILSEFVHDTGPSWRYVDDPDHWAYCDIMDFVLWEQFSRIT